MSNKNLFNFLLIYYSLTQTEPIHNKHCDMKTKRSMECIQLCYREKFSFCPFSWKNKKEIISNRKSNSVYTHCDISLIIHLFMDEVKLTACFRMVNIFIMIFRSIRI